MAMRLKRIDFILPWFLALTLLPLASIGQTEDWVKLWEVTVADIDKTATDGKGNVFITDKQGYLSQYNSKGEKINQLASRFLNPIINKSIGETGVLGWVSHASPGNNNSLWVYDESDLKLKKINLSNNELLQAQSINTIIQKNDLDIVLLMERYNLVFLQVANDGMYIFDNQANLIDKIVLSTSKRAVIEDDFFYTVEGNEILKTNYLTKKAKLFPLPEGYSLDKLALSYQQLLLANKKKVVVFERPKDF